MYGAAYLCNEQLALKADAHGLASVYTIQHNMVGLADSTPKGVITILAHTALLLNSLECMVLSDTKVKPLAW